MAVALAALTDEQRDAIALRFFAGLSAREAAVVMGKQEGTVRGLQFRAIAALRRQLGIDLPDATVRDDDAAERRRRPAGWTTMIDLTAGDGTARATPRGVRRVAAVPRPRHLEPAAGPGAGGRPSPGGPGPRRCRADPPAQPEPTIDSGARSRRGRSSWHVPRSVGRARPWARVAAVVLAASLAVSDRRRRRLRRRDRADRCTTRGCGRRR